MSIRMIVSALAASLLGSSAVGETLKVGAYACPSAKIVSMSNDKMLYAKVRARQDGCVLVPKGTVVRDVRDEGDSTSFVVRGVRLYAPWAAFTSD